MRKPYLPIRVLRALSMMILPRLRPPRKVVRPVSPERTERSVVGAPHGSVVGHGDLVGPNGWSVSANRTGVGTNGGAVGANGGAVGANGGAVGPNGNGVRAHGVAAMANSASVGTSSGAGCAFRHAVGPFFGSVSVGKLLRKSLQLKGLRRAGQIAVENVGQAACGLPQCTVRPLVSGGGATW